MTAFARAEEQTPIGKVSLELRSVNNRFLDPIFRLPEPLRVLETTLRERLAARVKRGRVEVFIRLDSSAASVDAVQLNHEQMQKLVQLQQTVRESFPEGAPMSINEVLQWPGIIDSNDADDDAISGVILPMFNQVLEEFLKSRGREGGRLAELISQRIETSRTLVEGLKQQLPEIAQFVRQRLETRISEVLERIDAERVEQEIVLLLNKSDVEEEIDRLMIHFDEVLSVLKQKQPVGRKLDFLMQELNREANTLGSKAAHTDVTNASMELKVLIEQMREQVQNLE